MPLKRVVLQGVLQVSDLLDVFDLYGVHHLYVMAKLLKVVDRVVLVHAALVGVERRVLKHVAGSH